MSEDLRELINITKKKLSLKDQSVAKIKYPKLFVSSLEELDSLVGNHELKRKVALHTINMLGNMNSGNKKTDMMNMTLTGPAGTGKSYTATVIAKIWYSMGYFNEEAKESNLINFFNFMGNEASVRQKIILIGLLVSMIRPIINFVIEGFREKTYKLIIVAVVLFLFIIIIPIVYNEYHRDMTNKVADGVLDVTNIISIVSRKDFVAEYLGQTAPKTRELLEANRGKVLFIDEAYSLCYKGYNGKDPYGEEALTELNQFLSENPDSIAVIFAGYEDKMKEALFDTQPGLERRCMFHPRIESYNGKELAEIFSMQLEKENYILEDIEAVGTLFENNIRSFKNYGGDTERLKNYVLMNRNKNVFLKNEVLDNIIRMKDIEVGLEELDKNIIGKRKRKMDFVKDRGIKTA